MGEALTVVMGILFDYYVQTIPEWSAIMSLLSAVAVGVGLAIAPIIKKKLTSPVRRIVKHRMKDGPVKRLLLMPLGYTKKAREAALYESLIDDHELLPSDQLIKRNSSR